MNRITVRFSEHDRYDIAIDADVKTFVATTTNGSYWTEFPADGPRTIREKRQQFKTACVEAIQRGEAPRRMEL